MTKTNNTSSGSFGGFWRWLKAMVLTLVVALLSLTASAQNVQVTATAGTTGPTLYATVSAAFTAINAGTHQGAITMRIIANTTEPAAPTALLKSGTPSSYTSVLITPFGGNYTIGGAATPTASRAIIELNGADNVTIDGDDPTVAGTRNLTIAFPSTSATIAACIRVSSNSTLGADGANNNTIKNCIITGNRASAGTTATYGINMSNYSSTSLSTGGYSSINNRFENNLITRCYHGIWAVGVSATYPNTGLQIVNNVFGDNTLAGNIGNRAILMSYTATTEAQAAIVSGNEVVGVGDPGTTGYSASIAGMEFGTGIFGTKIFNNYIHDVKQPSTGGWGSYGVLFSGATSADSIRFYNNIITRITASNYTTTALSSFTNYGVKMTAGPTFGEFSNNTIVLSTANASGLTANPISYALSCDVNGVRINKFRNNIIINSNASTNAIGIYTNNNAIFNANNYTAFGGQVWNNNNYYVPSGILGYYAATAASTFSAWKTASGVDNNSFNVNPNFVSASDLHINGSTASLLESGGQATPYATDFDGQARPGPAGSVNGGASKFDIGADEFDGVPITPVTISSVSATPNSCSAIAHTVTATVVQGTNAITSVVLSYTLNGTAQTPISMTNTSGNTWEATIPAATPTNATIAWTVTATDAVASPTATGSYQDDALNGIGLTASATPNNVCTGATSSLSASFYNAGAAPTSYTIQAVTNPTTDEDLGNVTITDAATSTVLLNNTTTYNSLSGTLGTATGTAGSYASYLTLATVPMTAGSTYNFSLSSLQGASAFSNSMAIYIDLNRDGDYADAGENVYVAAATTSGAHTETGSFTIPATANNGLTRMRVMVNEGLVTSPTMAISYGEREEYMVNISSANNGGGGNIPSFTYSWSDGTSVVGTTNPYVATVNAAATYTLTASTVAGCTTTGSAAVTTIALPSSPTATNSVQCGPGVATASVASTTGLTSPTYVWYAAQTGGTALQSSSANTYGTSISATTTLYVSENDGTCQSLRTPVTVTVNTPPSITTSGPATICAGQSTGLFVVSSNPGYAYNWSGGLGAGANVTASPLATQTYTVTATDTTTGETNSGCITSASLVVTVNASPVAVTITPTPAAICTGSSSTLNTVGGTISGAYISGGLNTVNATTGYPAPFTNYYGGTKTQWMYTGAELTALGYVPGDQITSLGLAISAVGSTFTGTLNNFSIALKNAGSLAGLTTTFETGLTSVGTLNWSIPTTGLPIWSYVTFATPFTWTGGAVVVQTSYSNANSGTSTDFVQTYLTNVGSTYCSWYRVDGATAATVLAATTATSTGTSRPDARLGWTKLPTWSWSPVSGSTSALVVSPTANTTYSTVATGYNGCTATASASVTVNPLPAISGSVSDVLCNGGSTGSITATGSASTAPYTYTLNGGNSNSTGLYSGLAAGTYTVATTDANGCSKTTSLTVNQPTACSVSGSATNVTCNGLSDGSVTFSAAGGTAPYSYTLNGTAATSPVSGLAAGSYTVVSTDANGCTASAVITVSQPAAALAATATASTATACPSTTTSVTVAATGGTAPYTGTGSFNQGVGSTTYTVTDANGCSTTASASVTLASYTVTASAGSNGSISDAGANTVNCEDNKSFTITADACYHVADVLVDGVSVGAVTSYSFTNVTADHTIAASFAIDTYTITATAAAGGTITASATVNCGSNQTYSVTPDAGYQVDSIIVNGVTTSYPAATLTASYTFSNVSANNTIAAYFSVAPCTTPALASAPATAAICSGFNYTLNGSISGTATSATWSTSGTGSFDNTAYGTGTNYTPSAADIAAGSVTITLTTDDPDGAGACSAASASTVLTINASPSVAISGNSAYCAGSSSALTASGASTYVWSTTATTASINANAAGTYSVVGTASNGCTGSASIAVSENPLPTAPVVSASGATTFCTGGSVTLTSDYVGGNTWSNGATTDAITVSASGNYSVTYTDANGCSATSASTTVTVNTSSVAITGATTYCAGGATTLTATATPAATGYAWTLNGTPTVTTNTTSASADGVYAVVTTDANGCTATASVTVSQAPTFTVAVSANCASPITGNSVTLTATPSIAGTFTYSWNGGLGSAQTAATTNVGTFTATVTDQYGCSAAGSYTISSGPLSGTYSVGSSACGSFGTLANVINHLNTYGVNGNVTINVPAGYTETAPAGGYQLKMCALAAGLQTGPTQTLTIQKSGAGANPVITSGVGTSTTLDAIFNIVGADNVTIDGINLTESAGNTTATTRAEWGYGVLKCDGNNGANDVTIRNCTVTLTNAYVSNYGIYVANHDNLSTTGFTNTTYTTTAQAARNKVSITNNTINSCYNGIRLGANPNVVSTTGECLNDTLNNISNNTITNFGGGATTASAIYYGNNRGITIRGNTISSSTTATSTTCYGINASSGTWATIAQNTIQNIVTSSTFYGIYHALSGGDATNPNIVRIDSNIIQTSTPTAGSFYGFYGSSTGGTNAQVSTSYNQFRNHTWAATSTATMYGMYQFCSGTNMTLNCNYNIVSGNVLQNTNTFYGLYSYATSGTHNMRYNTIRDNRLSPSSGTAYILYPGSSNESHIDYNNVTNNRRNVLSTATSVGTTYGMYAVAGSSTTAGTINNNVIDTLYITGVPGTATSLIYGLYYSATSFAGSTVSNNIIRNITTQGTSTGNQTIYASYFAPSGASNTFKGNRIARIGTTTSTTGMSTDAQFGGSMNSFIVGAQLAGSTTVGPKYFDGNTFNTLVAGGSNGIARGIWATTGIDWNIYNNALSRISAPFASPATAPTASSSTTVTTGLSVYGIDIANATAGYNFYVYNNSVLLSGNGGGANFASSGIHANVTPNVTLVNNLVINNTTSGSSQAAVAYRRSGVLSATYQSASDNNLFYAGTPGAAKLIYGEGVGLTTNAKQTLADYKTYVGPTRDANSRTEVATPFVAATTDSLLHIAATTATFVEGGGKLYPATALTKDIDNDTRSTTAPDIGADEGNFVGLLPVIVSVSAPAPLSQCTAVDHVITVVTGATVTGVNLNYTLNGVAQTAIAMSNGGSGTTWTATIAAATPIDATIVYSVTATDGTYTVNSPGSSYQDAYLLANTLTATVNPTAVCLGGSVALNAYIGSSAAAPTSYAASNATSTADEEILGVSLGSMTNTSVCGAVTTGGTAYTYSNYTTSVQPPLLIAGSTVSGSVTAGYCGTGTFSNIVSLYIDFNRDGDFADAGENAWNSAYGTKTFPSQVIPFSITIPSSVSYGKTRMRVVINESSSAPATGTYTYGETEDYLVTLAGGNGFSYVWSDGTSNVFTGTGTYTPSTAGNFSLSVTGTDPNGCVLYSSPVALNVTEVPVAPTATASTQCGNGIPAIKVSGAAAGTGYNWYLASTGGTPVQSGTVDSLTSYSISATTTFYVSTQLTSSPFCESPRTAVVATVNIPDPIAITSSANNVCPGTGVTLTANQTGTLNSYTYVWNGNGLASTTGNLVTATPTVGGSNVYNVTATDAALGCVTTASFTLTAVNPPSISGYSASPSTVCAGQPLTLSGTTTVITSGPQTDPGGYLNPSFSSTADEEIFNVTFGTINNTSNCASVAAGPGSVNSSYNNYTTTIPAATITAGQTVSASVTVGYCATSTYSNIACMFIDYNRDGDFLDAGETVWTKAYGTSLLGGTAYPFNVTVPMTATPGVTRMRVVLNESSVAPTPTQTGSWGEGEDYLVNILAPGQAAGSYTWSWSDGSSVIASTNTVSVSPTVPTTYTVTATDPATGCTSTATVTPTVNPLPSAPTATNSVQCGAGIPTASVASTSGLSTPQFNWYSAALNGTLLQGPPANSGPLTTVYTNNFNTSSLAGATISGNAATNTTIGGQSALQLTPNVTSNLGGITIPASGSNAAAYQINFSLYTSAAAGVGADGMSYSFGDDASATSTTINAEYGSGSKLSIGFDTYDAASTANGQGIRLTYGNTANNPGITVGTNGVLAYSTNTAWAGGTWVPVQVDINSIGKLTLTVNGTVVFSNVALPAGFTSANKANWVHVFKGRTGGVSQIHAIDDFSVQQSGPTAGYTTYNTSISNTTTFYVSEMNGTTGCQSVRTPVEVTVNQPDSVAVTATVASANNCLGTTVTLSATNLGTTNTYDYTWNGGTSSGAVTPLTGSTVTVTPTAAGTYTYTLTAVDAAAGCQRVVTTNVTINANPTIDSISATPSTICSGANTTLRAYSLSAGPQTAPTYAVNPSFTSTADEEIFNVTLGTLNNTSTCSSVASGPGSVLSSYNNYTTSVAAPTLVAGQSVSASVTIGYCATATYSNIACMFIDFNRNGLFTDAGETVWTKAYGASALGGTAYPFTVTIPATATPGLTRMRVVLNESSVAPTPTQTGSWGEGEDYLVNIIGLSDGGASTTWTWNPGSLSGNIVTDSPTATVATTQTYTVVATNAAGCTAQNTVNLNINPKPAAPTAVDGTICGFNLANVAVVSNSGATTPTMIWHLNPTGNASVLSGQSGLSLNSYYLSVTDTFYVQEQDAVTGCKSTRTAVIQNVTQPDALTAASSAASICLPGASINLSATQTGSTNNYTYSWTAVPPVGSGLSGVQLGPVTTLFSNDFTNSTLPSNVTVSGSASITGGVLQVTPNLLSQTGGVKITAGGNAADTIAVDFDLIVPQNGADGVSYSYSNDGVETVEATMNAENGTGSKLKLGFVSYTNGTSTNGIYLMYNCTTNEQTPSTTGVLAYSSNVSWRGSASPVHVAYTVGSTGLFNLSLNGTPVFTDIQLPASYLSANKSSWHHIFKGRTGGVSEEHSIDNMVVKVAQIQSLPTPGQNLTVTPTLPGTYTYQVTGNDGACNAISTVTVVVNPAAPAISAGSDVTICEGGNVTLNSSSAGLIPALRFTEVLWQVNAGTGNTGAGIPAWASTWYNANGGTTMDMIEITNLGSGPATSAGVTIELWNATSTTSGLPAYSYTIPSNAPLMNAGGLLYFTHSGTTVVTDLTNNFYARGGTSIDNGSGTAAGMVMRKNGVIIDAFAASGYVFPAASGVTASDWSGALASNSGLSGSILVAADNNTASSWTNTSALTPATVGTLNSGLVANLPSLGVVNWTSIPSGFTGTEATSTFGPITAQTTFVVVFDNGSCQSSDTVVVTPVVTPAIPVIVSNKDSICNTGSALYTASNLTQGATLQWQSYDVATSTWVDIAGATASLYTTPTFAPVNGDTAVYFRLKVGCTNFEYSSVDTLQIVKPFISSTVGDTVCGGGTVDLVANGNGTMTWYANSSTTTVSGTGTTYSPFILQNAVYWVRASVGTCLDPAGRLPVIAISNPAPTVTIAPATASICEGGSTTLTASSSNTNYTYTWNGGLGTGATVSAAPTATTTYNVIGTDATTGCIGNASVTVTVNAAPSVPVVTSSTAVACPGSSTTLTAVSIGAGPQIAPTGYCTGSPSTVTFADEQIFGVTFGSMTNNQTESCSTNYTDYTSTIAPITVISGNSYPFSVITDECDGVTYYSSGLSIYIDYNRDGDWDDAGEQAYTTTATTLSPNTRTGTVSIPSNASIGLTRMRVVVNESVASPLQCPTFTYGEMEDYLVNITGPIASYNWSTGGTGASISVTPPAGSTTYTVTATSAAGCTSGVGSYTVTTNPAPVPVLTATDTTLCAPNSINIFAVDNGTYAGVGYPAGTLVEWLGYGASGDPATTPINSSQGSTFQAKVTLPSGCYANSNVVTVTTRDIVVVPTITPAACGISNGKIVAQIASAPAAPYNYVWTDGTNTISNVISSSTKDSISGLAPGTYYLSVYDNQGGALSCSATNLAYTVGGSTPPVLSATSTNITCNGSGDGTVGVTITSGGAAPFTYSWSNGSTASSQLGVAAGTYTVTVSDVYGCSSSASVTVTEPAAITAVETITQPCVGGSNGSISLVVSGGTGTVSVDWFDGAINQLTSGNTLTGISAGQYFALMTDANSCTSIGEYNVTEVGQTFTSTESACDSYTWSQNSQTYTASGSYTSVSGCDTYVLNLTITPSSSNTTSISACDSYTWSVDGNTYTASGTYTSVTGCHTEILNLTITPSSSNTTSMTACDSYTWSVNGTTYTASGTYSSVTGCNTEILNLTINTSSSNTTSVSSCGSYVWSVDGNTYTQSGTYSSVSGCNTEVLNLTVTNVTISSLTPSSGSVGSTVVISGADFTGATGVSFNGTAATSYTVDNNGQITVTVPAGTTTGPVTVSVGGCSATSSGNFTIGTAATLNLKAYMQGYYAGSGLMTSVLANQGVSLNTNEVDTITVELYDGATGATLAASAQGVILTDGTVSLSMPASVVGNSYYIAVRHRNTVVTWSASAITMGATTSYDFTTAATQAYGDNMIEVETGVFAMYTGDMNQDEFIDPYDFPSYQQDNNDFASGYFATDLNGDGFVDPYDFPIYQLNNNNFVMSSHP